MGARDLRPVGPIEQLDRALLLVRRSGLGVAVRATAAGGVVALVVLVIFWLERVEGVRGLRPLFAAGLVAAFALRAVMLSAAVRAYARALWPAMPLPEGSGRAVDVVRTALVVGAGLWMWSWVLVAASLGGALVVALVLPVLCLRGGVAPTWLARAACTRDAGLRAFAGAVGDAGDRRLAGIGVELCVLLAVLGLTLDFWSALALGLLVVRSYLGLDIAFVDQFLSLDNTFVLLATFAAALVAVEPLRAALSAVGYIDARVRQEGLDLRLLIEEAVDASRRARRGVPEADSVAMGPRGTASSAVAVALLGLAAGAGVGAWTASARVAAQEAAVSRDAAGEAPLSIVWSAGSTTEDDFHDDRVRDEVARILQRAEFREFSDSRAQRIEQVIARFLEWLSRRRSPEVQAPRLQGVTLPSIPPALFAVAGTALLLAVSVFLLATRRRGRPAASASPGAAPGADSDDVRDRPPEQHIDDAARLALAGRHRDALRALYLATLVALDRSRLITFDPHLTNWRYLRQMPRGEARTAFAEFTRAFDHKWYGVEATTEQDYLRCRALAMRIVDDARASLPTAIASAPARTSSVGTSHGTEARREAIDEGPPSGLAGGNP
jgi:hypothetical protein